MRQKDEIVHLVEKALSYQFDCSFTWCNMVDCIDDLTDEEKEWAKKHTTYEVKEV